MKIRNGFVSNSSSSSFIVAIKKNANECPCCGRSDPNILDAIRNGERSFSDTCIESTGRNGVLAYADKIGEWDQAEAQEIRKEVAQYDDAEWELAVFDLSYHDETLKEIIKNAETACTMIVLHKGG